MDLVRSHRVRELEDLKETDRKAERAIKSELERKQQEVEGILDNNYVINYFSEVEGILYINFNIILYVIFFLGGGDPQEEEGRGAPEEARV